MKPFTYSLIAAAVACGFASAQTTAYTTPVGYTTQTLEANNFNLIGLNVLTPTLVAGQITSVAGAVVTVTGATFTTALPAGRTCILEVASGVAAGTVQEFVTWTADTITLPSAVAGLAALDSYKVRVAPTLEEIFGLGTVAADSVLAGALSAGTADKVWVPDGVGGYTKYYINTAGGTRKYRNAVTATDSPNVPLVYIDGILVEKKGTANSLVVSGEVKTTGSNALVIQGYNLIGVTPPVGLTLFTSGMQGDIAGALSAGTADIVWVPAGAGTYTKYWYKTSAPAGWHTTVNGTSDAGAVAVDVALTPSILIQRKSATAKVVSFDVPASYSSL